MMVRNTRVILFCQIKLVSCHLSRACLGKRSHLNINLILHAGVLETMEYSMAMLKLFEGAVYMHEGQV
jgi:hypothetical protein